MNGIAGAAIGVMAILVVFVLLFALAVSIGAYVLQSIGLYRIAKRRGIHKPWLAWLPVGNMWILGSISDQYQYVAKGRVRNRRKLLMGLTIVCFAISIPVSIAESVMSIQAAMGYSGQTAASILVIVSSLVMAVVSVVAAVIQYIAYYDLYRSCEPGNSVLYLALSIVFSITLPVFVFVCRNKDEGMPPRKQSAPAQIREVVIEESDGTPDDAVTEADFEPEE